MASMAGVGSGCTSSEGFEATSVTAPTAATSRTSPDAADDLLFVVRAEHGRVVLDEHGSGTLTMDDVDDVTWFSDRPERDAGGSTMGEALRTYGWRHDGDAVSADAPNATLTSPELGDDALVVELLAASIDGDRVTFEVRTVDASGARDVELRDLDLFIDTTTAATDATPGTGTTVSPEDSASTERPDPAAIAAAAGFGTRATLVDHLDGLLDAVGVGPGSPSDRTVQVSVSASYALDSSGARSTVPVELAVPQPAGFEPSGLAGNIAEWLSVNDARVDTLTFDVSVYSTDPATPVLVVRDVDLPLANVDLPST